MRRTNAGIRCIRCAGLDWPIAGGQHLTNVQLTRGREADNIRERATAIYPELPMGCPMGWFIDSHCRSIEISHLAGRARVVCIILWIAFHTQSRGGLI